MKKRKRNQIPYDLKKARERFEHWRSTRNGRMPIPEELWRLAAKLATKYRRGDVAQVLRMNSSKLKTKMEAFKQSEEEKHEQEQTFVELPNIRLEAEAKEENEVSLEVTNPDGSRLLLRTKVAGPLNLIEVMNAFKGGV